MSKIIRQVLEAIGKRNIEPIEATTAQTVKPKFVKLSFTEEQPPSLDQMDLTLEELSTLVRNANRVGTEAAMVYKKKQRES